MSSSRSSDWWSSPKTASSDPWRTRTTRSWAPPDPLSMESAARHLAGRMKAEGVNTVVLAPV